MLAALVISAVQNRNPGELGRVPQAMDSVMAERCRAGMEADARERETECRRRGGDQTGKRRAEPGEQWQVEKEAAFMNQFRARPAPVAERVFVSCGMYESLIYENRSLVPMLEATGMDVRYVEARDGHNWENWRDRLREGLSWLFPGPFLLVYE